ncbi:unnamed protein product, partial [Ectocarpus fasciculatus]
GIVCHHHKRGGVETARYRGTEGDPGPRHEAIRASLEVAMDAVRASHRNLLHWRPRLLLVGRLSRLRRIRWANRYRDLHCRYA